MIGPTCVYCGATETRIVNCKTTPSRGRRARAVADPGTTLWCSGRAEGYHRRRDQSSRRKQRRGRVRGRTQPTKPSALPRCGRIRL